MWVVPRAELTEDQLHAVNMSTDKHRIVVGGPGSGKTLVLAHRAEQLLASGVPPERLRILVYTNVLAAYIDGGLTELGLPKESAATFDSWCLGLFHEVVTGPLPRTKSGIDFDATREAVLKAVGDNNQPIFDALLVDEGQDLTPTAVRLLAAVSRHVTLALDARQQLYSEGIDVEQASQLLGVPRASASLLSAYRCTPLIVDVASQFLPSEQEASDFRAANLLAIDGIETPVLFKAEDANEEMDRLTALIGERAMLGQSTAVLVPTRQKVEDVAEALLTRGLQVATRTNLTFDDLRPIVMTYHSAKGLTVDAVFLPGLTAEAFPPMIDVAQRDRMLFVGITRAVRWVWLGTRVSESFDVLDKLSPLVLRNSVIIQSAGDVTAGLDEEAADDQPAPAFNAADLL